MCSKPFRWQESLFRFKHIFGLNDQRTKQEIPIYYLPGNHDIGYSAFHSVHPEVINHSCFPPLQAFHLLLSVISCYYLFWKVFYFSSHAPLDKDRLPCIKIRSFFSSKDHPDLIPVAETLGGTLAPFPCSVLFHRLVHCFANCCKRCFLVRFKSSRRDVCSTLLNPFSFFSQLAASSWLCHITKRLFRHITNFLL
jgi:hypothetical protein